MPAFELGASALIASVSVGLRTTTTSDAVASGVVEPPLASQPQTSHAPGVENVVLKVLENAPFWDWPLPPSCTPLSGLAVGVHAPPPAGSRRVFA